MSAKAKSNEWYTPARYVEAARKVMGDIDLDPASCELANRTVKAKRYYTQVENGLAQEWRGRTWLNPPYGKLSNKSMLEVWIMKLIGHYLNGDIPQAILLATNNIEAPWFDYLWNYPICFVDHEVRFGSPKGLRKCHLFGTTLTYFGPNEATFIEHFSQFGRIAKAIDTPKKRIAPRSLWEEGI